MNSIVATSRNAESMSAQYINREHALARDCAEHAVQHAIRCGQLLLSVKAELRHGDFRPWIRGNCLFSQATATRYMTAASQNAHGVAFSSLRQLFPTRPKNPRPGLKSTPWIESAAQILEIPMDRGLVTFGTVAERYVMVLFESRLSPGYWHDLDLRDGTASIRPCLPWGIRLHARSDAAFDATAWIQHPDTGEWTEGEENFWKESPWRKQSNG